MMTDPELGYLRKENLEINKGHLLEVIGWMLVFLSLAGLAVYLGAMEHATTR